MEFSKGLLEKMDVPSPEISQQDNDSPMAVLRSWWSRFATALASVLVVWLLCAVVPFPRTRSHHRQMTGKGASLAIWTQNGTRNDTAQHLPGILFEDIAHSGDGGIYAELIQNRAFQGSGVTPGRRPELPGIVIESSENPSLPFGPTLDGWHAVGEGVEIYLDLLHPLSDALQCALQINIPSNAKGEVGFYNGGWWGMSVTPQNYNASFHVQTSGFRWNGTLTHFDTSLRSSDLNRVFASSSTQLDGSNAPVPWMYQNYSVQIKNTESAPTTDNVFAITMDAEEARGQTFYFSLISLFPETLKNRPNGLRKDLAEKLDDGGYRFLRFPGGNNLEGYSIQRRWKWWETIGPLVNRPGRPGDWSYYNTDGLGLLEFMIWCEDMNWVPLLGIYAGFSLDISCYDYWNSTDANELPVSMMGPILQEALDELEFLMGNTSTYWGSKRAEYGHPEPFDVPYIEIGNEDFFSHHYPERAEFILSGLRAQYPNITYIYTAPSGYPQTMEKIHNFNIQLPEGVIWDEHIYTGPKDFISRFDQFDNWREHTNNQKSFASIMEYHVNMIDRVGDPRHKISAAGDPRMLSAVAEAVAALGWERNPDVFKLYCFAPAIQNYNFWRHTPYLLLFDADPENTVLSTSYHRERLFNLHHGTQTLSVTFINGSFDPLFWQASIDVSRNEIYFKIVNAGPELEPLHLQLDTVFVSVNGTTLHAPNPEDLYAMNTRGNEHDIVPLSIPDLEGFGKQDFQTASNRTLSSFAWTVPPWSVNVIQFNLANEASHQTT